MGGGDLLISIRMGTVPVRLVWRLCSTNTGGAEQSSEWGLAPTVIASNARVGGVPVLEYKGPGFSHGTVHSCP